MGRTDVQVTALGFGAAALGNLYAAQFMEQARRDLPGLEDDFFEMGPAQGLLNFLPRGCRKAEGNIVSNRIVEDEGILFDRSYRSMPGLR